MRKTRAALAEIAGSGQDRKTLVQVFLLLRMYYSRVVLRVSSMLTRFAEVHLCKVDLL